MGRQAEEKKLTVGGVCTDYIEFGNGNIPLVLVPGLSLRRVKGTGLAIARGGMISRKALPFRIWQKIWRTPWGNWESGPPACWAFPRAA